MAHLEVGDLRLVAGVGEDLEAHLDELVDATKEHVLLTEEIGLGLFLEGGLDRAGAQGTKGLGISEGQIPAVATRILLNGGHDRNATAGRILAADDVARALRGDHEDRVVLGRLDVAVVDVEAVREGQSGAFLDVRLDVVLPDALLILVRGQDHDHIGFGSGFRNALDLQALFLGELHGLRVRTQADDDIDTGVTQVERMRVALRAVTDDCDLLAVEDREIAVVFVPDLCCHNWHSFVVCGAAILVCRDACVVVCLLHGPHAPWFGTAIRVRKFPTVLEVLPPKLNPHITEIRRCFRFKSIFWIPLTLRFGICTDSF